MAAPACSAWPRPSPTPGGPAQDLRRCRSHHSVIERAASIGHWVAENAKTTTTTAKQTASYVAEGVVSPVIKAAGLPAVDLRLEHESTLDEAGQSRQVKAALKAVAFGATAERLARQALGSGLMQGEGQRTRAVSGHGWPR